MISRARQIALALLVAAGLATAIGQLNEHYPIRQWLFWTYLEVWAACALFALACLLGGYAVLRRIPGLHLPLREQALYAFACGVLIFVLGIFAIGLVRGLGALAFFAWPAVMIAADARAWWGFGSRAVRLIRHARTGPGLTRPSPVAYALFAFGAVAVLGLYLNILTPHNLAYDARWYHVAVAEHYAADHAIARFPEGWFQGAVPQLASYVYTWAFLLPGASLFTHLELAAHLEMVLFLATLAALPLLVRWLLHGTSASLSWVALFLFPGILIYDSTLSGAADHVLAFWAPPLFLAAARLTKNWSRSDAVLLGLMASGAVLTKYQAVYLLLPIALGIAARCAVMVWRRRRIWPAVQPVCVLVGLVVALTSVHWLKNLIWYGDPLYPALYKHLSPRPWNPDADPVFNLQPPGFMPQGTFGEKLKDTVKAVATFAFRVHDWERFHRDWPVFGFLFTLFCPLLILLPGARRARLLAAATLMGVGIWYWTLHQDRYLQALVPWMSAVVAAVIWRCWRGGWVARASVAALVALQVIWGGDHYALSHHVMFGQQPLRLTMDLLAGGFEGRFEERLGVPADLVAAGKALPKDARALFHEQHVRLGLGRPIITDARGSQGALSYRRARSPREVWENLRAMGVTHLVSPGAPWSIEKWADEAVFYDFAAKYLVNVGSYDGIRVGALSPTPPSDRPYGPVAVFGCGANHRTTLLELDTDIFIPKAASSPQEIAAIEKDADFIVIESACRARLPMLLGYQLATSRSGWETWVRSR